MRRAERLCTKCANAANQANAQALNGLWSPDQISSQQETPRRAGSIAERTCGSTRISIVCSHTSPLWLPNCTTHRWRSVGIFWLARVAHWQLDAVRDPCDLSQPGLAEERRGRNNAVPIEK